MVIKEVLMTAGGRLAGPLRSNLAFKEKLLSGRLRFEYFSFLLSEAIKVVC